MSDLKGHSPQLGCKWTECHGDPETTCPFFKGVTEAAIQDAITQPAHVCEWRQLIFWQGVELVCPRFYCIHDPTHRLDA